MGDDCDNRFIQGRQPTTVISIRRTLLIIELFDLTMFSKRYLLICNFQLFNSTLSTRIKNYRGRRVRIMFELRNRMLKFSTRIAEAKLEKKQRREQTENCFSSPHRTIRNSNIGSFDFGDDDAQSPKQ
jgi:hypothetical protein